MRNSERAVLGGEILERALQLADRASPGAVDELLSMAGGRRPPLEAAAALLVARLHGRSSDFAATGALCSVNAALNRIGWEMRPLPTGRRWGLG